MKLFSNKKGQANTGFVNVAASHISTHTADQGTYFLIIAGFIFLLDLSTSFFGLFNLGPRYSGFTWIWGYNFLPILLNIVTSVMFATFCLVFVLTKIARRQWQNLGSEVISFGIFAIIMTFLLLNNNWIEYPKAFIHFIFIIVFGFTFVRTHEESSAAYLFIAGLLAIDFFGYALVSKLVILRYIPVLFMFTIFYIYSKTQNTLSIVFFSALVILMFFLSAQDLQAQGINSGFVAVDGGKTIGQTIQGLSKGSNTFVMGWRRMINSQVQYAITGKVEQNKYEPLGVYLGELRSDQPRYYDNEAVSIWGTVKARTLDEPVAIKLSCLIKDGSNNWEPDKIDPANKYQVFSLEEQDFACLFNPEKLRQSSSKTITASAEFNFETLAYVKRYFIDAERERNMIREKQDPFEVFKIKERNPVSVSTNGPAEIDIRTNEVLYGVSSGYAVYPVLELSIQNRLGWEGKITRLKELIILFPKGAMIPNPENRERGGDCSRKFLPYDVDSCITKSCVDIYTSCIDVCNQYKDSIGMQSCIARCDETGVRCEKDCEYLFVEDGQQYIGYSLDLSDVTYNQNDYDRFLAFQCKFDPQPSFILENSPITTKSFRVKARYDYKLEKSKTISIQQDPFRPQPLTISNTDDAALVIRVARQLEVPEDLAFAVAAKASTFNHCRAGTCSTTVPKQLNCNYDKCGIMGIDRNYNAKLFGQTPDLPITFGCQIDNTIPPDPLSPSTTPTQTAYDKECNLRIGLEILKQLKDMDPANYESLLLTPPVGTVCNNQMYKQKYKDYRDWDKALRAYDGYGCTAPADPNYVENIKRIRDDYNSGKYDAIKAKAASTVSISPSGSSSGATAVYLGTSISGHKFGLSWPHPAGRTQSYRFIVDQIIEGPPRTIVPYGDMLTSPSPATYTMSIAYPGCTQCTFRITLTEYSGAQIGTPFTATVTIPPVSTVTSQYESTSSPFVGIA